MRVEFTVEGKPPKKSGANSMWGNKNEAPLILELRKRAWAAMGELGINTLSCYVKLELVLRLPEHQLETIGDLDNYVGGVQDGLQAASPNAQPLSMFYHPKLENINPNRPLVFEDDRKIIEVCARKEIWRGTNSVPYWIAVETIRPQVG